MLFSGVKRGFERTGLALLVWGAATCFTCRSPRAQITSAPWRDFRVTYSQEAAAKTKYLYDMVSRQSPGFEFVACLYGDTRGDSTHVKDLALPVVYSASREGIIYGECPDKAAGKKPVGAIHSHLTHDHQDLSRCIPSRLDVVDFLNKDREYRVLALACGVPSNGEGIVVRSFPRSLVSYADSAYRADSLASRGR